MPNTRCLLLAVPALGLLSCLLSCGKGGPPSLLEPFDWRIFHYEEPALVGAPCVEVAPRTHAVYLIGDAGAPKLPKQGDAVVDPVLASLEADVLDSAEVLGADQVTVVYLGDNVYPKGLAPEGHPDRARGERVLQAQIQAARPAWTLFTAGNHDWHREGSEGVAYVNAEREYLDAQGERVGMLPPGGCAGPDRWDIGKHLRLVFIDQVGWHHVVAHPETHPPDCREHDALEVFYALAYEFDHPDGRHVIMAAHHPLLTAGPHGGHYTFRQHVFPLTDFVDWLWIPLPIVGSIYPISRQLGVTRTDVTSEPYKLFVDAIYRASRPTVPMAVAAGHEHSLQVHQDVVGLYNLVSGAGSAKKVNRVEKMDDLLMAEASPGWMRLDLHDDGALDLTVYALDHQGDAWPIYQRCLADRAPSAPPR